MSMPLAESSQGLRDVRRGVAQAGDAQVLQVVRMVDAMENRGATDAVLEPVRARLRVIQPARPLRFARLLFMPVDPLIVAPKDWRTGTPFLPRTALMVLAHAVRRDIEAAEDGAALLARVDGMIAEATTAQTGIVRQAGALVWPPAAAALRRLAQDSEGAGLRKLCAAEWAAEGLARAELLPVAASLAPILAHAAALHDHEHALATLQHPAITDMLAAAEREGARPWSMMASLLTIRVPQASPALLAAAEGKAGLRSMAGAAAETALGWLERETADQAGSIGESAPLDVARHAALLEALMVQPGDATRRRRLAEAKAHLVNGCVHRLEASLHDQVAAPLQALPAGPAARDAALDAIETTARTLRRFEVEARRIGAADKFDSLTQGITKSVFAVDGIGPMDRARLIEILAGPAAAARCLSRP